MVVRLEPVIQPYAWGSPTAIPELLGVTPSGQPQAELWLGAHPAGPARLPDGASLDAAIAADPLGYLGPAVAHAYGDRMPYLLKILAAAEPLSLQAHPDAAQAAAGFAREQAAGLALDDPCRVYKDSNAKPELICALTPFTALCGFRDPSVTRRLLEALAVPALAPVTDLLDRRGLAAAVEYLLTRTGTSDATALVADVASACAADRDDAGFVAERGWATQLAARHPDDPGVVVALLLNLVELQPGEAIELTAGALHLYLAGVGVEIMGNSDNVLRGGLTPKHVDVPELVRVLDSAPMEVTPLTPRPVGPGIEVWDSAAPEFRLTRLAPAAAGGAIEVEPFGPEVVLVVDGSVTLDDGRRPVTLERGQAAFVAGSTPAYEIAGAGMAFRATVGGPAG